MKMSLPWHITNLANFSNSLENAERVLHNAELNVDRMRKELEFRRLQIDTAIAKRKQGFDGDRYCKPKEKSHE